MDKRVALLHCQTYDLEAILSRFRKMVDMTAFPEISGKKVLLKPNVLSASEPEKAVTTHPVFLQAVIRLMKEHKAGEILVGDSCGVGSSRQAAEKAGILEICRSEQVEWVDFKETTVLPNPEGSIQKQFYTTSVLQRADLIFSLPKMKTHAMMYYTGAMKNLFGLFPGLAKAQFHFRFPDKDQFAAMIVDLNLALKADYALMDGILAMEGHGPGNGDPRQMGLIFGSSNLLALDITASRIMGYKAEELPIHKNALSREYWLKSSEEIEHCGEKEEICNDYKRIHVLKDTGMIKNILPNSLYKWVTDIMVPRPHFRHKTCILCGKCVKICPADALSIEGQPKKKVHIDYQKCIRCYCCDEVCPVAAIRISRI